MKHANLLEQITQTNEKIKSISRLGADLPKNPTNAGPLPLEDVENRSEDGCENINRKGSQATEQATKGPTENLHSRYDLRNTLREVMSEEMKKVWDQIGDIERTSKTKNSDYSEKKVPLSFSKDLLDEPTSDDTRALKMQSYEGLSHPCDYLNGFIYAVKG
ncbi:hypothetical protein C1H46_001844 [Malus baccata]|uniref:Uncharacterized protein n=1 Tax=Malus baccata TaxID=106549 RepID=A0A540NNM5_MALBA|nr:hypothetical protein C1H46_001844 [Malus baccata]